ncbi:MAG: SCP2 sterol-binding domain-containing protein [Promethearchaeia archaeon]
MDNDEFKNLLDKYLQNVTNLFANLDEIKQNFSDMDDIYQFYITDIDFQFWFKIKEGSLSYSQGLNENYDIKFKLTKEVFLKIITLQIQTYDAYMRGLVKSEGELSYVIQFRNFFNEMTEYISFLLKKQRKKKKSSTSHNQ